MVQPEASPVLCKSAVSFTLCLQQLQGEKSELCSADVLCFPKSWFCSTRILSPTRKRHAFSTQVAFFLPDEFPCLLFQCCRVTHANSWPASTTVSRSKELGSPRRLPLLPPAAGRKGQGWPYRGCSDTRVCLAPRLLTCAVL